MIESRCGLLCSECEYKTKVGCDGCLNIGKPFYGLCQVKTCAENNNVNYCGECVKFPCELLKSYSYDKEQGDDGKRIATCEQWKKNKVGV